MIARRHRHQTGTVWLKSGSWYLRFYAESEAALPPAENAQTRKLDHRRS